MFKITLFLKVDQDHLLKKLEPHGFTLKKQQMHYNKGIKFKVVPFSVVGRESQGYRVYSMEDALTTQYLIEKFLGDCMPEITAIELKFETCKQQLELVRFASNIYGFTASSVFGLFNCGKRKIAILPSGEVLLQQRSRSLSLATLYRELEEIVSIAGRFNTAKDNLFSFGQNERIVAI